MNLYVCQLSDDDFVAIRVVRFALNTQTVCLQR